MERLESDSSSEEVSSSDWWGLVVDRGGLGAVHVLCDRHNVQTHLVVYRLRRRLWIL